MKILVTGGFGFIGTNLIKKDDCLVILGKGHEETQEKDGQILFFSDHEVVNEIYN